MLNADPNLFTVIIQFEVPTENQKRFAEDLTDTVGRTIATLPGMRSATFFASDDGTTVINLAQWESKEIYEQGQAQDKAVDSAAPSRDRESADSWCRALDRWQPR